MGAINWLNAVSENGIFTHHSYTDLAEGVVMKKYVGAGILIGLFACSTHAQESRNGVFFSLTAGLDSMTLNTAAGSENFGQGSSVTVGGGYEFVLTPKVALLVGGMYDLDYYLQGGPGSEGTSFKNGTETINQKIRYSIYVAPGLYVREDTLLYGKAAYVISKTDPAGIRSTEPNFGGVGLGAGLRFALTQNSFLSLEMERVTNNSTGFADFRNGLAISPSYTNFTLGLVYKP